MKIFFLAGKFACPLKSKHTVPRVTFGVSAPQIKPAKGNKNQAFFVTQCLLAGSKAEQRHKRDFQIEKVRYNLRLPRNLLIPNSRLSQRKESLNY